jgi:DNA-binding XRE family transcriptional regulator
MCKRGHDKNAVGVIYSRTNTAGYCRECKRIKDAEYAEKRKHKRDRLSRFCRHNHDTELVGTVFGGRCAECQRLQNLKWYKRMARERALSNPNSLIHAQRIPNLRKMRSQLGMTQRELGERSGVSHHIIQKIESRGTLARPHTVRRLVAFFATEFQREKDFNYG